MPYWKDYYFTQPKTLEKRKIDDKKVTYHLTLSVILKNNNESALKGVVSYQNSLLNNVNYSDVVRHGIYKYPTDRIHFSLLNFSDLDNSECRNQDEYILFMENKISLIKKTIKKISNELGNPSNKKINIGFVYTKKSDSIALQAFLSDKLSYYIQDLSLKLQKELSNDGVGTLNIKGFDDEHFNEKKHRFAINIVRFFRITTDHEDKNFVEVVNDINNLSKAGPLVEFDLNNINFIVSDNWLSNDNYDLDCSIKL